MKDAKKKHNHTRANGPKVSTGKAGEYQYFCAKHGIPMSGPYNPGDWPAAQYSVGSFDFHDGLGAATMSRTNAYIFLEGYKHAMSNMSHFARSMRNKGRYAEPVFVRTFAHVFADLINAQAELDATAARDSNTKQNPALHTLQSEMRTLLERQMDFYPKRPVHNDEGTCERDVLDVMKEGRLFLAYLLPVFIKILYAKNRITGEQRDTILNLCKGLESTPSN